MAAIDLENLRSVRDALGATQNDLASYLGVSLRAVQSYEQGWRETPSYVQRAAALLLYLRWRKAHRRLLPCWEVRKCSPSAKADCPTFQFRAGDLCWLFPRASHNGHKGLCNDEKLEDCKRCRVMKQWLRA